MQIQLHKILDVGMCYDILRSIRWDSGVKCTNCQSETVVKNGKDSTNIHVQRYHCHSCRSYFDDLSDTIFSGSHQPLHHWITVLYLMNVQIADRWHILKNLTEGFEGFLNTQRESLRDISTELSEEQQLVLESIVPEVIEIAKKDIIITGRYHDNLLKVRELQREGVSKRKMANILKMSRHTIDRYWNRTSFLQKVSHQKSNILDFEDYLIKRWQEGEQQVKVLLKKLKSKASNTVLNWSMIL